MEEGASAEEAEVERVAATEEAEAERVAAAAVEAGVGDVVLGSGRGSRGGRAATASAAEETGGGGGRIGKARMDKVEARDKGGAKFSVGLLACFDGPSI